MDRTRRPIAAILLLLGRIARGLGIAVPERAACTVRRWLAPTNVAFHPLGHVVSGAAATLYLQGGYYDDTVPLSTLLDRSPGPCLLARPAEVQPAWRSARPLPAVISGGGPDTANQLCDFYRRLNDDFNVGPPTLLLKLRDVVLHANVVYMQADGRWAPLYETLRTPDRTVAPDVPYSLPAHDMPRGMANLYLGSAGTSNYGHWLLDDLPRLADLAPLRKVVAGRRLRVVFSFYDAAAARVRAASVRDALPGMKIRVVGVRPDQAIRFRDVFYITPVSYHPILKNPHALRVMADRLAGAMPAGRARLFVTREARHGRVLENQTEIATLLAGYGFRTVSTEGLDFCQQVALFRSADWIVGQMGAAMANLLFSPPGARALLLAPEGWTEPFYWDLTAMLGQTYGVCFGIRTTPEKPVFLSDFRIQPAALMAALKAMAAI